MNGYLFSLIKAMPKAELHLHLDGSLGIKTAIDLMRRDGAESGPLSWQKTHEAMVISEKLRSQRELLRFFDLPVRLLQSREALFRAAGELIRLKAADNVKYAEMRFAPSLHTKRGLDAASAVKAVSDGARQAAEASGVRFGVIAVFMRGEPVERNVETLAELCEGRHGIAAIDVAGDEAAAPNPLTQTLLFDKARELGLGVTMHWGEVRGDEAVMLRAIERIQPERVAHGALAAYSPALMRRLKEQGVTLDLCPTSNIQAGLFASYEDFPIKSLLQNGVGVSVSTDDTVLSDVSLSEEYHNVVARCGISIQELWRVNLASVNASFAPQSVKESLLNEFTDWARNISELSPQSASAAPLDK